LHIADYANLADEAPGDPLEEINPLEDDVVGLFYTSGSTGGPKGVMLTHRNVFANAIHYAMIIGPDPARVFLHAAPMFHLLDVAYVYCIAMMGSAHCFLATFDPEAFLKLVEQHRGTITNLVPTMINMVTNHPAVEQFDTSSLKELGYGDHRRRWTYCAARRESLAVSS